MRKKISPTQVPTASAEQLQAAKVALGEKPPTPMEKIKDDKKFLAETPKQIKPAGQLAKTIWEQASEMLRQEEEKKSWYTPCESADDTPEIIYCLEDCDYLPGDELGDDDEDATPAGDNGTPSTKKKAVDLYPDAKIHFQKYQFDPGLKRGGVTLARSLPDHIFEALKLHQAVVGPAAIASGQSSWGQTTTARKFIESVAGDSDEDAENKNLGFGLEPEYKSTIAVPREPTPQNAWVFSEERYWDFIVRLIDDKKLKLYEKDPDNLVGIAQLFKRALKAHYNLFSSTVFTCRI